MAAERRFFLFFFFMTLMFVVFSHFFSPSGSVENLVSTADLEEEETDRLIENPIDRKWYVIENDTLQVVISNLGGAIEEINIPLSDGVSSGAVLATRFDKVISDDIGNPNGDFPLHPYALNGSDGLSPSRGGYYPLMRRWHTPDSEYRSLFSTISDGYDDRDTVYVIKNTTSQYIQLEATLPDKRITKTYSLQNSGGAVPYCIDVVIMVEGDARSLWIGSGAIEVELIAGKPTPTVKYNALRNGVRSVEQVKMSNKVSSQIYALSPNWVALDNGYFSLIVDPLDEVGDSFRIYNIPGDLVPTRLSTINSMYQEKLYPAYSFRIPLKATSKPIRFRVYAGPSDKDILSYVDKLIADKDAGCSPNYSGIKDTGGWGHLILKPFSQLLYFIMSGFYYLTGSWGLSIILLTISLRLMIYPLNSWSMRSTLRLQWVSPQIQKLQDRHKKDPRRAREEVMKLYKQHNVNPFGGCLPLLIQMPFLLGMFTCLKSAFSIRGVSFMGIFGSWISDLTTPDILFSWQTPIPFIGNSFHLLPIFIGIAMFIQQKMSFSYSKKKGIVTAQQQQQHKFGSVMTVVFTILFYKLPSGLNIYWFSSMALQILQQWIVNRKMEGILGNNSSEYN